jgi:hypothetical protein
MSQHDLEMARVAQRCTMEALDHSRAAEITLTTDTGEHSYSFRITFDCSVMLLM